MAQQGHQFGDVNIRNRAQVQLGDIYVRNQYNFLEVQERSDTYRILYDSLCFAGIGARVRNVAAALPTTCKWLRDYPHFIAWAKGAERSQHDGFLYLKGKPGSGKSTIMKETLVWAEQTWSDQIVLSYFFNARSPHSLDRSSLGLYRSLVWQLLVTSISIREMFVIHFTSKVRRKPNKDNAGTTAKVEVEDWTEVELQNFLVRIAKAPSLTPIAIFIDALDEGADTDVRKLITFLERLAHYAAEADGPLRICLSSRHYPHITVARSFNIVVEDQAEHGEDIALYISSELRGGEISVIDDLRQRVQERSAGIFLWVVLVVLILNKAFDQGKTTTTVYRKLNEIPADLHDLFTQTLLHDPDDHDECIALLQCVLFARYPLGPLELFHAMKQISHEANDEDCAAISLDQVLRYLRSCSRGLVELTKADEPTVQFIHETVRNYLMYIREMPTNEKSYIPTSARSVPDFQAEICHEKLAQACLLCLLQYSHKPSAMDAAQRFSHLLSSFPKSFPLALYAAKYWWQHLQLSPNPYSPKLEHLALKLLLDDENSLRFWLLLDDPERPSHYKFAPPLYYMSLLGDHQLVAGVLAKGADVNARGGRLAHALLAATMRGHKEVVHMLLDAGADINAVTPSGQSALILASTHGYKDLVRVLINAGADPNAGAIESGFSALQEASMCGNKNVVQALLDSGADVNALSCYGESALYLSSKRSHKEVVQMLLNAGADINARTNFEDTALMAASRSGYRDIVEILSKATAL